MISDAMDSDRNPSMLVRWHLAHCEDCRRFCSAAQALTHQLIVDAAEAAPARCADLPAVMLMPFRRTLAVAVCVLCLAAAGVLFWNHGQTNPTPRGVWLAEAVDQLADVGEVFISETPFEQELSFIAEDASGAFGALVACAGLDTDRLMLALCEWE
jgi:hypothetical protein